MQAALRLGNFELIWLNGGRFEVDGGAIFGVVPKLLWNKKYPCDKDNFIPLVAWPILIRTPQSNILIETGIGNKLNKKQRKIYRLREEWNIIDELNNMGLKREDIDYVVLTHYDFDHAGGVVMADADETLSLTFTHARHIVQKKEWEDVLTPNRRSINTYWPINNELLRKNPHLLIVDNDMEIEKGINLIHTGGHNRGHQIVRIESMGSIAYHLGDLLPTHAHFNPLWVMAFDNFPLDTIHQKERFERKAIKEKAWFLFYHDPFIPACRFDEEGNMVEHING